MDKVVIITQQIDRTRDTIELLETQIEQLEIQLKEARIATREQRLAAFNALSPILHELTEYKHSHFRLSTRYPTQIKLQITQKPDGKDSSLYSNGPSFRIIMALLEEIDRLRGQ